MFKKILYPTDFSAHSKQCIDYILRMQNCGVEEVVLLHVMDKRVVVYGSIMSDSALDEEMLIKECTETAEKKLNEMARIFQQAGIRTKTIARLGEPFAEILTVADEVDASLIVIGHRGHSTAEKLLLGSTAEKVVRKCKRPILLVR